MLYICTQITTNKSNDMKNLSIEAKTETAMKMVIMDAMEKGHTNQADLIQYMKSEVFEKQVKNYIALFNE